MKIRRIVAILLIGAFIQPVFPKDLGIFGQTWPIQEENFLEFIKNRIRQMQTNGEWNRLQTAFRSNVEKHADRPHPIDGLTKTVYPKTWHYDPSITVPYDLRDGAGRVFARAGTTVNPLSLITLHKALIFFNGDDKEQVAWAERTNEALSGHTKLILVRGSVMDQEKQFGKAIYFDQEGRLTHKFQIQHVPAVVTQDGLYLKISEVLP